MARKKKRPFTSAERAEVEKLSAMGIRGQNPDPDRCSMLFKINPDEYGEINGRVRREIQESIRRNGI